MFCGQCGKRVMENMLFCPFCGSPIVIPDQDGNAPQHNGEAVPPKAADAPLEQENRQSEPEDVQSEDVQETPKTEATSPRSLFSDEPEIEQRAEDADPIEEFVPLSFDFDAPAEDAQPNSPEPERADAPEPPRDRPVIEDIPEEPAPKRRSRNSVGPKPQDRRPSGAYIPPKDVDMDDLFMDEPDAYDDDDYDLDDDYDSSFGGKSYQYVEEEEGGFFARHVRGIVALILLAVVIVVLLLWSLSNAGQTTLAQMNLAWKADVYSTLADQAYKAGSKLEAAQYYEKAFARESNNYEYAHSSMVAYYESGEIEKAAAMLKKCIAMRPNEVEPYQEMLVLYPDAASRPWEITEIVRDGYSRTGDERLNVG